MKFTLEIELGNEAMQSNHDIADALETVCCQLIQTHQEGTVRDANGNRVGVWKIVE